MAHDINKEIFFVRNGTHTFDEQLRLKKIMGSEMNAIEKLKGFIQVLYDVELSLSELEETAEITQFLISGYAHWIDLEKHLKLPYYEIEKLSVDLGIEYKKLLQMEYKDVYSLLLNRY